MVGELGKLESGAGRTSGAARRGAALQGGRGLKREASSRRSRRAVVRFGPRGRGEYERPNYENGPV